MSGKTLIKGGTVLTLGARTPNLVQGDVLLEEGRIAAVGAGLRARDAEVVDATDTIVMPGFVDAHRRTWKTLLRHLGEQESSGHAGHLQPDDVYAATLLGLLSAAETGITTVVDRGHDGGAAHADAALQAHRDAGLRTVYVAARGADLPQIVSSAPTTVALGLDDLADEDGWALARQLGLRVHAQVSASGVVTELAGKGALGPDVTLVHCAGLDDADLDAVAAQRAGVVLTPSTEMALGVGMPPVQQLIDREVRPGLGVGDESVGPGDLFAQMRAVQAVQHATLFERKLAGKAGLPNLLTTRDVIRYATIDGAVAVGLGEQTGSLEPGKQADIVVLRTDTPNISPVNDPIGAVVWGMDPSNVDWVFVGGRALVRAGVLEADVAHVRHLADAARQRLVAAAGDLVGRTR